MHSNLGISSAAMRYMKRLNKSAKLIDDKTRILSHGIISQDAQSSLSFAAGNESSVNYGNSFSFAQITQNESQQPEITAMEEEEVDENLQPGELETCDIFNSPPSKRRCSVSILSAQLSASNVSNTSDIHTQAIFESEAISPSKIRRKHQNLLSQEAVPQESENYEKSFEFLMPEPRSCAVEFDVTAAESVKERTYHESALGESCSAYSMQSYTLEDSRAETRINEITLDDGINQLTVDTSSYNLESYEQIINRGTHIVVDTSFKIPNIPKNNWRRDHDWKALEREILGEEEPLMEPPVDLCYVETCRHEEEIIGDPHTVISFDEEEDEEEEGGFQCGDLIQSLEEIEKCFSNPAEFVASTPKNRNVAQTPKRVAPERRQKGLSFNERLNRAASSTHDPEPDQDTDMEIMNELDLGGWHAEQAIARLVEKGKKNESEAFIGFEDSGVNAQLPRMSMMRAIIGSQLESEESEDQMVQANNNPM